MYHKPVCVKCGITFRPEKNGVGLLDLFMDNTKPYQVWDADLWKCPDCGAEIVVGFGSNPVDYHFNKSTFSKTIEGYKAYKLIECREDN